MLSNVLKYLGAALHLEDPQCNFQTVNMLVLVKEKNCVLGLHETRLKCFGTRIFLFHDRILVTFCCCAFL